MRKEAQPDGLPLSRGMMFVDLLDLLIVGMLDVQDEVGSSLSLSCGDDG
jgi:hypothetical protein